jgi:hypothetical protein
VVQRKSGTKDLASKVSNSYAVYCRLLQFIAVYCSLLQFIAVYLNQKIASYFCEGIQAAISSIFCTTRALRCLPTSSLLIQVPASMQQTAATLHDRTALFVKGPCIQRHPSAHAGAAPLLAIISKLKLRKPLQIQKKAHLYTASSGLTASNPFLP